MKYKLKNNVYCAGKEYKVGDIVDEKVAKLVGLSNCEAIKGTENKRKKIRRK